MNIIQSALRKPISVVVGIIGVLVFALISMLTIAIDIFPALDLPTIYIAQPYGGIAPDQMDGFIAARYQDQCLYVSGIKNIEIKSIQGLSLLKLSFYPGTDMAQAAAEVANQVNRARALMPDGTVPPQVVRFDASSVPVGQLVFESETRGLSEIQDLAAFRIRSQFATIPGVSSPPPFGGNARTIVVKVNPERLRSYGLTPENVVKAISANNQPSAAGNVGIGDFSVMTPVNSLARTPAEFLNIPLRTGSGPAVFVKDVGTVEDAADLTVGYALVNGRRAIYIPVIKKSDASTLTVVNNIKAALPKLQASLPEDVHLSYEFDQSVYVVNALKNLVSEGALGALLTGLMVLLFLRDWRSSLIVVITIPISIAAGVMLLKLAGQTVNVMTLSGLALAIGVLVDQATVSIENIHQHLEMGKPKARAILDACREIAFPELLILLCILAVFAPAFIMEGIPKSMFLPLSLAVGFSMIASYLLAQTFVPVLSNWLLKAHQHTPEENSHNRQHPTLSHPTLSLDNTERQQLVVETIKEHHLEAAHKLSGFDKFRERYGRVVERLASSPRVVVGGYLLVAFGLAGLGFWLIGTDILPKSNVGQFQLRLRAPDGTRFERTEQALIKALAIISKEAGEHDGKSNVKISSSYVGTQPSSYAISTIFVFTSGPHEAVAQIALEEDATLNGKTIVMAAFKERLRKRLQEELPSVQISFEPIELVEKIMSQGSPTPIEVVVAAKNINEAFLHAQKIEAELRTIPFLRDIQIAQPLRYPIASIEIDRRRAGQLGVTAQEITRSMIDATSSSRFTEKNLWLDPKSGLPYQVQVQIPTADMHSVNDIAAIPLKGGEARPILADVATITPGVMPGQINREGPNRYVTVTANIHSNDLGSATKAVQSALARVGEAPRGMTVSLRGLTKLLTETLASLQTGLLLAIVVIFLLLSANFQSFKVSLVILSSVPAVVVGGVWMLLACRSTLNLQSYMGVIMSVGVSVANAILMITNAESLRIKLGNAREAAQMAAKSRLRPILMTSIAMVAGMVPMASGLGEGGDQVAPLGQAVIGGLVFSTLASLLVLPVVFALVQRRTSLESVSLDPEDPASVHFSHSTTH
jgi:multidrug efflux pump subunit AcrB